MTPHFSRMWLSSLSAKFPLSFWSHYSWVNSPSSILQPLSAGTLSTTSSNFHLAPSGRIVNISTSFRIVLISPVGHFTITPPLYDSRAKYPPPTNSTPYYVHPLLIPPSTTSSPLLIPPSTTSNPLQLTTKEQWFNEIRLIFTFVSFLYSSLVSLRSLNYCSSLGLLLFYFILLYYIIVYMSIFVKLDYILLCYSILYYILL